MAEFNSGTYSETDANNTAASPNGWPSGTYFNQVEPIGRATLGGLQRWWDRMNGTVLTTGSANAYIYTPVNTSYPVAYVTGEMYTFRANFGNTGPATLNINGLGAKNIYIASVNGLSAFNGGEIVAGQIVTVMFDGVQFQMLSIPSQFKGTSSNTSVYAGNIGEYIVSNVAAGSAISLSNGVAANVTSITLTGGDWDVNGVVGYLPSGTTILNTAYAAVNTTSATLPSLSDTSGTTNWAGSVTGTAVFQQTGKVRILLSSTTTVYLIAYSAFSVSTNSAFGYISARRLP